MALTVTGIDSIAAQASELYAAGTRRDAVIKALKQKFQGLTITGCSEDDLTEEPFSGSSAGGRRWRRRPATTAPRG